MSSYESTEADFTSSIAGYDNPLGLAKGDGSKGGLLAVANRQKQAGHLGHHIGFAESAHAQLMAGASWLMLNGVSPWGHDEDLPEHNLDEAA